MSKIKGPEKPNNQTSSEYFASKLKQILDHMAKLLQKVQSKNEAQQSIERETGGIPDFLRHDN